MVKKILIIGLNPDHAGKTSLAQAFLNHFSKQGLQTSGFKPFSGYNYWYHFDMAHQTLSQGRLYSKDITKLEKQSNIKTEIELLNPIHRLWNEPAIMNGLTSIPPFIMDRFSLVHHNQLDHHLLINQQLKDRISEVYQEKIKKRQYTLHYIDTIQSMNTVIQSYYKQAIESCYQQLKKKAQVIIIESYADTALIPWKNLGRLDAVFGIKAWEITKYNPKKYEKALQLSKPVSAWETSTKKLTDILKPEEQFHHKPTLSRNIIPQLTQLIPTLLHE